MDDIHAEAKAAPAKGARRVREAASPFSSVVPARVKTDPPTREDGRCIQCEKRRPPIAVEFDDPFCSNVCCRIFYGCPLRAAGNKEKRGASMLEPHSTHAA
jgi:hypothetical protein